MAIGHLLFESDAMLAMMKQPAIHLNTSWKIQVRMFQFTGIIV